MEWFRYVSQQEQQMLKSYYSIIPELDRIEVNDILIKPFGTNKVLINCYLPFPDKEILKWKLNEYNRAGVTFTFYGTNNLDIHGLTTCIITRDYSSLEITELKDKLLFIELKSDFYHAKFNCSDISISNIHGYKIDNS